MDYNVTFATSGTRIVQTFGTRDAYLYLYDASGTLLASNDDSGYNYNALIRYSFIANTKYMVRVKFYSVSVSDYVTLSISPSVGILKSGVSAINQFDDIYSVTGSSATYSTTLDLNQVKFFVFIPNVTKSYTITTTQYLSNPLVDTYLYLIDPTIISPCLYDDDSGGSLQARIITNLTAGKKYLIVISAYNITYGMILNSDTRMLPASRSGLFFQKEWHYLMRQMLAMWK